MRCLFLLLAFLPLWTPNAALAFGDCADATYVAAFSGSYARTTCEERETFTLRHGRGMSNVRVVSFTGDSHGDDAVWIDRLRRNLADIGAAMASMGSVGTDDITILLAATESAEGWEAEAYDLAAPDGRYLGECAVTVYKVLFEKERHFRVELAGAEAAEVRMQDESFAWSNLPISVSTCPEEVTRLAYAVTSDGPGDGTLQFLKEGVDGPGACCLEGKWTATPETLAGLAAFGNEIGGPAVAGAGGEMSCAYAGGRGDPDLRAGRNGEPCV